MGPRVLLTPEAFMRPTGGVRRYAVELEKAIATFGESERIGEGLGLGVGRFAGRRVGGSVARLAVDARASSLARRADLAHSVYYDCSVLGTRMPLIVSFHDCIHERFSPTDFRSSVLAHDKRRSVERARFVLSISQSTAHDVAEFYGLESERSIVVNPPVGDAFTSRLHPSTPTRSRSSFLYVGPRGGYKNWQLLVRAIGSLSGSASTIGLISVGGGYLNATERSLLTEVGIEASRHEWIERLPDEDLAQMYRESLAVVCPSSYEGFGYPIAEALCAGGVAVASDGGSLSEFEPYGCVLYPAGNLEALRAELMNAVQAAHASDRAAAIDRAVRAQRAFGRSRYVDQLSAVYTAGA